VSILRYTKGQTIKKIFITTLLKRFSMQYMSLLAMALMSMVMHNFPKDNTLPMTRRVAVAAENTKEEVKRIWGTAKDKLAAMLVFFGGDSREDQLKRLQYSKSKAFKFLFRHPKTQVVFIVTAKKPCKNPDGRISDAQYQEYYLLVKKLEKGEDLTYEEEVAARQEAMQLLFDYRQAKGLPQTEM
jgi:hypothetical protein